MPPPWYNVKDAMTEPEPTYTATIDGRYEFVEGKESAIEHAERKLIDALKAIWRLQGKRRKIVKLN